MSYRHGHTTGQKREGRSRQAEEEQRWLDTFAETLQTGFEALTVEDLQKVITRPYWRVSHEGDRAWNIV